MAAGIEAGSFYWDVMVADAKGYFQQNGIKPKFLNTKDGPGTVQAVTAGSAPFGVGATDAMVSGIDAGANVTVIAGVSYSDHALLVTKDIKSYDDLKGQKIASSALGAGSSLLTTYMLRQHGINPKSDVHFVLSGGTPERFAAMKAGGASATLVAPPALETGISSGFHVLEYANDAVRYMFMGAMVNKDFAQENPQLVKGFVAALAKANAWLADPANRSEAEKILEQYTKSTPQAAAGAYDTDIKKLKIFPEGAKITPDLLTKVLGVMGKSGSDAQKYLDASVTG